VAAVVQAMLVRRSNLVALLVVAVQAEAPVPQVWAIDAIAAVEKSVVGKSVVVALMLVAAVQAEMPTPKV